MRLDNFVLKLVNGICYPNRLMLVARLLHVGLGINDGLMLNPKCRPLSCADKIIFLALESKYDPNTLLNPKSLLDHSVDVRIRCRFQ